MDSFWDFTLFHNLNLDEESFLGACNKCFQSSLFFNTTRGNIYRVLAASQNSKVLQCTYPWHRQSDYVYSVCCKEQSIYQS